MNQQERGRRPSRARVAGVWRATVVTLVALVGLGLPGCGRSAPSATPGFDGETIRLGVLTPLSGPVAPIGKPLTAGGEVFFQWLNEERGGIAGRYKVELVLEDTAYDNDTAIAKYQKVRDDVALFAQVLGTPVVKALKPFLDRDGVIAAPASLDADWVRERHLLALGATYQVQFANAAAHFVNEAGGGGKRLCFAGIASPYGDAGLAGLESAARSLGTSVVAAARFNASDTSFTAPVNQLRDARCDAVFMATFSSHTSGLIGEAAGREFEPLFVVQATGWSPSLASGPLSAVMARSVWVMGEGPEWNDRSVPGQADLLDHLARYRPDQGPDYYTAFGYYQARAVAQVLEQAAARDDFTREGMIAAMESVGTITLDGLSGDYPYGPPAQRRPPRASSLFTVDPSRPLGLAGLRVNFETAAAAAYDFG